MLDIARLYHPAYSNDPRILACAPPCPKSPTAVQRALPRQEHSAAADRGSRLKSTRGSCSPTPPVATTAQRAGLAHGYERWTHLHIEADLDTVPTDGPR